MNIAQRIRNGTRNNIVLIRKEKMAKNEEEYDICVSCGKVTSYKKTDNILYRSGYIEGAGQLCFVCSQIRKLHKTGSYDEDPEWIRYG